MANTSQPFGTLLGLPTGVQNEGQLRQFRRREEQEKFTRSMKEASAGMEPQNAVVFNQFAQLGSMLGQKMSGGAQSPLTEQDEQGLFAMEAFNKFQAEAKQAPGYAALDATEQGFTHQESMIKALQQSGRHDEALALAGDLNQKRLDYRVKTAQASKLEAETAEESRLPTQAERVGEVVEFHSSLYGQKERQQHRELLNSSDDMVRIAADMADAYDQASEPGQITGNVGGMNRLVNTIGRSLSGGLSVAKKITTSEGGETTLREISQSLSDDIVPEAVRGDANAASRYKAAIMQMVYADARLNEPGARQLSDADIENAMVRLGVDNNDPQAVVDVFFGNMENRMDGLEIKFREIGSTMEAVGGNEALGLIYGGDPLGTIAGRQEAIRNIRGRSQKAVEVAEEIDETDEVVRPATLSPAVSRYLN